MPEEEKKYMLLKIPTYVKESIVQGDSLSILTPKKIFDNAAVIQMFKYTQLLDVI